MSQDESDPKQMPNCAHRIVIRDDTSGQDVCYICGKIIRSSESDQEDSPSEQDLVSDRHSTDH